MVEPGNAGFAFAVNSPAPAHCAAHQVRPDVAVRALLVLENVISCRPAPIGGLPFNLHGQSDIPVRRRIVIIRVEANPQGAA